MAFELHQQICLKVSFLFIYIFFFRRIFSTQGVYFVVGKSHSIPGKLAIVMLIFVLNIQACQNAIELANIGQVGKTSRLKSSLKCLRFRLLGVFFEILKITYPEPIPSWAKCSDMWYGCASGNKSSNL